jgi:hypothetical protein
VQRDEVDWRLPHIAVVAMRSIRSDALRDLSFVQQRKGGQAKERCIKDKNRVQSTEHRSYQSIGKEIKKTREKRGTRSRQGNSTGYKDEQMFV